jgi:hypothetical protein
MKLIAEVKRDGNVFRQEFRGVNHNGASGNWQYRRNGNNNNLFARRANF